MSVIVVIAFAVVVLGLAYALNQFERFFWKGITLKEMLFPAHRELARQKNIYDALAKEHRLLYKSIHDVDGLKAEVNDLKTVLEWNRDKMAIRNTEYGHMQTKLEDAKQEILRLMRQRHEMEDDLFTLKLLKDEQHESMKRLKVEMRKRALYIHNLGGKVSRPSRGMK